MVIKRPKFVTNEIVILLLLVLLDDILINYSKVQYSKAKCLRGNISFIKPICTCMMEVTMLVDFKPICHPEWTKVTIFSCFRHYRTISMKPYTNSLNVKHHLTSETFNLCPTLLMLLL